MKYLITIFCILLLLSGCAPLKIMPEHVEKIQRIGAISLLGNNIEMLLVGTTVFNNDHYYRDSELEIDKKILTLIKNHISPIFEYVELDYDERIFTKAFKINDDSGFGVNLNIETIKPYLEEMSAKYNLDALIFVTRRKSANRNGHATVGDSIYTRYLLGSQVETIFSFQATYSVIDLKKFKLLARSGAYCTKDIPNEYWFDKKHKIELEEIKYIQTIIKEIMPINVEIGLAGTGLINSETEKNWGFGCEDCCKAFASDFM
jgi:hypothetical protein